MSEIILLSIIQGVTEFLSKGLPVIFLHPAAVYGPGPSSSEGVNGMIRKIYDSELPALLPGGMPFVLAEDVAKGHLLAEKKASVGERFILSETYYSLREFVGLVLEIEKMPLKFPFTIPYPIAKIIAIIGEAIAKLTRRAPLVQKGQLIFLQWQSIPNSNKAIKQLNWSPTPIKEGLIKTITYLKNKSSLLERNDLDEK